jgi:hypothetical protein
VAQARRCELLLRGWLQPFGLDETSHRMPNMQKQYVKALATAMDFHLMQL